MDVEDENLYLGVPLEYSHMKLGTFVIGIVIPCMSHRKEIHVEKFLINLIGKII